MREIGLFDDNRMARIKALAARLLAARGIELYDAEGRELLEKKGYAVNGTRVRIPEDEALRYLEEQIGDAKAPWGMEPTASREMSFSSWVNCYSHSFIPPGTTDILPFTTEELIRSIGAAQHLGRQYGQAVGVCGYPADVPVQMQDVCRYFIESQYSKHSWPEPMSASSFPYLMRLAEVHGCKTLHVSVYSASPMRLGDESYQIVRRYPDKVSGVTVAGMPSFGATTPFAVTEAFATILAETLGGAILINALTGIPAGFHVAIEAFDFRYMTQGFGTPEKMILERLTTAFNEALYKRRTTRCHIEIHTQAALPGVQSCAEKGMSMMNGYHLAREKGADITFRGMGTLGMDEIFSAAQLVIDLEMLTGIQRLERGYAIEEEMELDELLEDLEAGFMASERTAANMRTASYNSRIFHRYSLDAWRTAGREDALARADEIAREAYRHPPVRVVDDQTARALDEVYQSALRFYRGKD